MQETSPEGNPAPADKPGWRRELRRRLAMAPPDGSAVRIAEFLGGFLDKLPPSPIATFAALPGEPDILALIDRLPNHRWCLPRVDGDTLAFHEARSTADLRPGSFRILEPAAELPVIRVTEIAIFLCPGLGFGRDGSRLGRGRGFYDRALAMGDPAALRIGVAFDSQITPSLPVEAHDLPMTHLATPSGILAVAGT